MKQPLRNCDTFCGGQRDPHLPTHTVETPQYQPVSTTVFPYGNQSLLKITIEADTESLCARNQSNPPAIKISSYRDHNSGSVDTIAVVVTISGGDISNLLRTSGQGALTPDQDHHNQCLFHSRDNGGFLCQAKRRDVGPQDLHFYQTQELGVWTTEANQPCHSEGSGQGNANTSSSREPVHSFPESTPLGMDPGLSVLCCEEIRRRLESLAIANPSRASNAVCVKQEPHSGRASPAPATTSAVKDELEEEPFWQWDPEAERFRHWDTDDDEWVYYPKHFD